MGNYSISTVYCRTKIRLGEHDITTDRDCPILSTFGCNDAGVQDFDIEKVVIHKEYNSPNVFQNDIAIVKLKTKVVRNGKSNWHLSK